MASFMNTFRRREDHTPCPKCQEKDGQLAMGAAQRAKVEERVRLLEAEHDAIHLCSPASTLARVRTALVAARVARDAFSSALPPTLAALANCILGHRPVALPSVATALELEAAHEAKQLAIRAFAAEVLPLTTGSGEAKATAKARMAELPQLIAARDEARGRLVQCIEQLVAAIEATELEARVQACSEVDLPALESLLALCPLPEDPGEEALDHAVALLQRFSLDTIGQVTDLESAMEGGVRELQGALAASSNALGPGSSGKGVEGNLNELWQQAEAAAHRQVCFVRRHEERCWGLEGILVAAGHGLHQRLEAFRADARHLLDLRDHLTALREEWDRPAPTIAPLLAALERLRTLKKESITKNAEFAVQELGDSPEQARRAREELEGVRRATQEQQLCVEAATLVLAVATATHHPELPLLYDSVPFHDVLGKDHLDGLWKKGRRLEDYDECERLTGGRHVVVVASFAGKKYALKEYNTGTQGLHALRTELLVLSRLRHPNVVTIDAVVVEPKQFRAYVQMPYCSAGTMSVWIKGGPTPAVVRTAIAQVLQGLAHMHASHVVHCDVKMDNVLMVGKEDIPPDAEDPVRAVLADFDVSLDSQQRTATAPRGNTGGSGGGTSSSGGGGGGGCTLIYAAPEVQEGRSASYASDMWSFGCLMGLATFPDSEIEFLDDGDSVSYSPPPHALQGKGTAVELLLRLFAAHPLDRPPALDALLHPYFTEATGELRARARAQSRLDDVVAAGKDLTAQAQSLEVLQAEHVARARRVVGNLRSLGHLWHSLVERRAALDFCDLPGQHAVAEQQGHLESSHADILHDLDALEGATVNIRSQYAALRQALEARDGQLEESMLALAGRLPGPPMYWSSVRGPQHSRAVVVTSQFQARVAQWLKCAVRRIDRVERLEDGARWGAYVSRRILTSRSAPIPNPLDRDEWVQSLELDREANEQLLWHAAPSHLAAQQLRTAVSGPYGRGLYFGTTAEVALSHASVPTTGVHHLVLARVIAGKPFRTPVPCPTLRRPPRTILAAGGPPVGPFYNCVTGPSADSPGQVFVVFDRRAVFPEFVITYVTDPDASLSPGAAGCDVSTVASSVEEPLTPGSRRSDSKSDSAATHTPVISPRRGRWGSRDYQATGGPA